MVTFEIVLIVLLVLAWGEIFNGRMLVPHRVKLWGGTEESSRQVLDWYSPSHFIHGLILYALTGSFIAAVIIEAAWELLENSPFIINRYRQTSSADYEGDTVLNSMSDVGCMALGFWLAGEMLPFESVMMALAFELITLVAIRDNLTLNILMLIYPFERIKRWQLDKGDQ